MPYIVTRMELEGPSVIATACTIHRFNHLWEAQNQAERLARSHPSYNFDQDLACWQGRDAEGRTFRYTADRPVVRMR